MIDLDDLFIYDDGLLINRISKSSRMQSGQIAGMLDARTGRAYIRINEVRYQRSILVWAMHNGKLPAKGMVIDHINGNPNDDRIENLREVSQSINLFECKT